jgi:hypothetical protein
MCNDRLKFFVKEMIRMEEQGSVVENPILAIFFLVPGYSIVYVHRKAPPY